jgi:4-amino-4-deoxy-L-arabinose transferase-like glycosyltransferase
MNLKKEGFLGGFLVLGFIIFLVGFLAGMVAVALIPADTESTTLAFMVFVFGFITGMVTVAMLLAIVKLRELTRHSP